MVFWNGVILNHLWIVTTADSVSNAQTIRADIGHVHINRPALRLFPNWYIVHPQYNADRFVNNLGLVRMPLNRPITFPSGPNQSHWPIRLPTLRQQYATFEGAEAFFSGWGLDRPSKFSRMSHSSAQVNWIGFYFKMVTTLANSYRILIKGWFRIRRVSDTTEMMYSSFHRVSYAQWV